MNYAKFDTNNFLICAYDFVFEPSADLVPITPEQYAFAASGGVLKLDGENVREASEAELNERANEAEKAYLETLTPAEIDLYYLEKKNPEAVAKARASEAAETRDARAKRIIELAKE